MLGQALVASQRSSDRDLFGREIEIGEATELMNWPIPLRAKG
jgi:hypothetical protein